VISAICLLGKTTLFVR